MSTRVQTKLPNYTGCLEIRRTAYLQVLNYKWLYPGTATQTPTQIDSVYENDIAIVIDIRVENVAQLG